MKNIYLLSKDTKEYENVKYLTIFDIINISFDIDFSKYDALIFTSKNAIYSLENNTSWKDVPSYAIAPKTAQILKQYNSNLKYTGKSGHGDDFAKELIPIVKNKKLLYIRAKKVVSNLVNILNENNILCDELISYETSCKYYEQKEKPLINSIIIFTSPSTIKCFLNNFTWDDSYIAVCIGKTTSKYLPKEIKYYISEKTSIESCISLANSL